jgi:hypothetical protein
LGVLAIVVVLGGVGPSVSAPQATAQAGLFSAAQPPAQADTRPVDRWVIRQRFVTVNFGLLNGTPRGTGSPTVQGDVLPLNLFSFESQLFPDVAITAVRDRVERAAAGTGYVWVGHVQGVGPLLGTVTIAVENGIMYATIRANDALYRVQYAGTGTHVVQQLDERALPIDHGHLFMRPEQAGGGVGAARAAVRAAAGSPGGRVAADAAANAVRVLVIYTPGALAQEGGAGISGLNTKISSAVSDANQGFTNSGVDIQISLAGQPQAVTYNSQQGTLEPDLRCITPGVTKAGCPEAVAAGIQQMRLAAGADLVSLWVEGTIGPQCTAQNPCSVGIGWVMFAAFIGRETLFRTQAYTVVMSNYATAPNYTFAHEIGHNMAANHDHATDDPGYTQSCTNQPNPNLKICPYNNNAFDWVFNAPNPADSFRTIMAYPQPCNGCPVIPFYSNPTIPCNGQPACGVGNTDNHATLNVVAPAAAGFCEAFGAGCVAVPTATPTPTPTATPVGGLPTPVVNCNPRPRVTVSTQPAGANNLQVTIQAGANGWINQIGIGAATNARIDIAGQTGVTGNQTFPMPPGTTSFTFVVHHATLGQATTVPLTVVDTCGSWQTFVGGGGNAF